MPTVLCKLLRDEQILVVQGRSPFRREVPGQHHVGAIRQYPGGGGTALDAGDELIYVDPGATSERHPLGHAEERAREDQLIDRLADLPGPGWAEIHDLLTEQRQC
jgi:hypothetical protein